MRGVSELSKITAALFACLKPVSNAFLLLFVFTAIYAVVGTHLYHQVLRGVAIGVAIGVAKI